MFDWLRVEVDLPDGYRPEAREGDPAPFQTKSLDCELVTHTITADGRLILERITGCEIAPKEERPFPDAPDTDPRSLFGSMRTETVREEDTQFAGEIEFVGLEVIGHEPADWHPGGQRPLFREHRYRAVFEAGRLQRIEVVAVRGAN
jgi:hypothetical protein